MVKEALLPDEGRISVELFGLTAIPGIMAEPTRGGR